MNNIISFLKNILYTSNPFVQNLDSLIAIIAIIMMYALYKPFKYIFIFLKSRYLYNNLLPLFTEKEVKVALTNYIQTKCQNPDPSIEDEPRFNFIKVAIVPILPFFLKILDRIDSNKYYLILADTGMGKTTFMINLFIRYHRKVRRKHDIILIPLGNPKACDIISQTKDKKNTILLLDAFDEYTKNVNTIEDRLKEILLLSQDYYTIIITCRTQYFPNQNDEPYETGLFMYGPEKKQYKFNKMYISPFDEKDIKKFIRKKYSLLRIDKRKKAKKIIEKSPDLMARPMLLQFIDILIESESIFYYSVDIYKCLIEQWILREYKIKDKNELRRFTYEIAKYIYMNRNSNKGLYVNSNELERFARENNINLQLLEMKSNSLLNRTVDGKYKFSHKSVLEYILAELSFEDNILLSVINIEEEKQISYFIQELQLKQIKTLKEEKKEINIIFYNRNHSEYFPSSIKEAYDCGSIFIDNITINSIRSLEVFKNMRTLDCKNVKILSNYNISYLNELTFVYLDNCEFQSLSLFAMPVNVKYLTIRNSNIINVDGLNKCVKLVSLELWNNNIENIDAISDLNQLCYVKIINNPIVNYTPLLGLKGLREVEISIDRQRTKIEIISRLIIQIPSLKIIDENGDVIQTNHETKAIIVNRHFKTAINRPDLFVHAFDYNDPRLVDSISVFIILRNPREFKLRIY